jgi:hypothetical protein
VTYSHDKGSFLESGNDDNAIGTGELSRRNVSRLRHLIKHSGGFPKSRSHVIRARRGDNGSDSQ